MFLVTPIEFQRMLPGVKHIVDTQQVSRRNAWLSFEVIRGLGARARRAEFFIEDQAVPLFYETLTESLDPSNQAGSKILTARRVHFTAQLDAMGKGTHCLHLAGGRP